MLKTLAQRYPEEQRDTIQYAPPCFCFDYLYFIYYSVLLLTSRSCHATQKKNTQMPHATRTKRKRYCHKGPDRAPGPCYRYWNNIKSMPEYKEADYWQDFKTMGTLQSLH